MKRRIVAIVFALMFTAIPCGAFLTQKMPGIYIIPPPYGAQQIGVASIPAHTTSAVLSFTSPFTIVIVTPSWNTTVSVTSVTATGCLVVFGTECPGGTLNWEIL